MYRPVGKKSIYLPEIPGGSLNIPRIAAREVFVISRTGGQRREGSVGKVFWVHFYNGITSQAILRGFSKRVYGGRGEG